AEIVMNVFGDTGAFLVEGSLLLQMLQLQTQPAKGDVTNYGNDCAGERDEDGGAEPPRLPEKGGDHKSEGGIGIVPNAFIIAGVDSELIAGGRQPRIEYAPVALGRGPIIIQRVEPVAEGNITRTDEAQGGEVKLQAAM